jgi:hypothetical protein
MRQLISLHKIQVHRTLIELKKKKKKKNILNEYKNAHA